ncbi:MULTISPECIES: hypothetical protein [Pseudomonas syringae group]|uniref:Uncharacterized protein n=2 Tax=Pseudomonas syringae group TaxID=136849 RepID=A0A2K4WWM4_PSESX|nr:MULTISPECIES: hypothetical protein [Pseudomonas syringae group]AVB14457.1 hypothetical protein BKM19_013280 [Pseudomonas amygdali pv. morsprunorum]KWS56733.1 hypothetical protein AL056_27420 [Pseudomonas amygdali pv. morsprunorum]KWS62748.1 hypothetical protein AL054_04100 [Pseudomonas amygdali pv. morsprunorum]MDT3222628.1 hypothetical protein [Pseudomonas amygdali pv. morsprunorum]MDT3242318.1 hypothetical protein [Pseudomonas amygdali pv. morsprunorum]
MIEKYLPRLLNAGPYFQIVLLMGDASARTLLGAFRTRLKALDIAGFGFKEYWFKTDTGIVLSISGSKLIIQLFTMFLAEFDGHYFQGFETIHSSHGPVKFEKALRESFQNYTPSDGSRTRFHGGSYA